MTARNVLLLIADDLGRQVGCYGDDIAQTPNLDRLASEGIRFTKAFASTASCSGSRTTIYTGLHTHHNGQYGLASHRHHFQTFDHVETAPGLLSRHGYLTGIIGKVHVGPKEVYPWEIREESDTRDVAKISDRTAAFFDRSKTESRPFFLTVGFVDPHRDRSRAGFGNTADYDTRVKTVKFDAEKVHVPDFLTDSPGTRQELASYYESINRLDQGVGLILAGLDNAGLRDETLVIFLSDNGPPFVNSKTTLYDAGVNLPFIVRPPSSSDTSSVGIVNPNLISYVDILPTILEYAGHPEENERRFPRVGRSFLSILTETQELASWDHVYGSHTFHEVTNYWPTRYLRDRQFKYHRNIAHRLDFPFAADLYGSLAWDDVRNQVETPKRIGTRRLTDYFLRPPEELYDLEADPLEVNNLARDPQHAGRLQRMRQQLEDWQRRTEDPWLYRDGVSLKFVQHHLGEGLKIPDRFDFDPENTENQGEGVEVWEKKQFGVGNDVFVIR
ncbi:alkaline phosphatase-like protein [Thozetella sp. PMI_491]|nr:alkaline phosphatase-like protein [Thozetella sp. PMI_491]